MIEKLPDADLRSKLFKINYIAMEVALHKVREREKPYLNKGGKFLKKLRCCDGGRV